MRLIARLSILLCPVILMGCSYISKPSFIQYRDKHYLTAQNAPPLKIPPGISSNSFQNYYPMPYRDYPQSVKDVSAEPPGLNN